MGFGQEGTPFTFCFTHKETLNVASADLEITAEAPLTYG